MKALVWAGMRLLALPVFLSAEDRRVDHNVHGWYNYFGDHPIGKSPWGVHLEGQWRRHDVITRWQQLLLRPGVNYEVNGVLMLTAGYAYIRTYPYGDYPTSTAATPEHRIWEQALLRYRTDKVRWSTRLRLENRFLGSRNPATGETAYRYENRFRVLQQIRVPLKGPLYLTGYDEVWLYVKPYVSHSVLDQNRAYAALGFQWSPHWRFEAGYMNQAIWQRSGAVLESNHTLMFSLYSTGPFGKR